MTKITTQQRSEKLWAAMDAAQQRWPMLKMEADGLGVRIGDNRIASRIELRYGDQDLRPKMEISTGTTLCGSATSVEVGLRIYRDVLDATYAIMVAVEDARVALPGTKES